MNLSLLSSLALGKPLLHQQPNSTDSRPSAQKRPPSRPGLSKSRDRGQLLTAPKASSWRFYKALFLPTLPSILTTLKTTTMVHPQMHTCFLPLVWKKRTRWHSELWLLPGHKGSKRFLLKLCKTEPGPISTTTTFFLRIQD